MCQFADIVYFKAYLINNFSENLSFLYFQLPPPKLQHNGQVGGSRKIYQLFSTEYDKNIQNNTY